MKKIILPSGATLEITPLPFEQAWEMFQDVAAILKNLNIDLNLLKFDINEPSDILKLGNPILSILSNKEIVKIAKSAFTKTLYDGFRIDDKTFENESNRKDFIIVVFHHIYENVSPFLSDLISYLTKKLEVMMMKNTVQK